MDTTTDVDDFEDEEGFAPVVIAGKSGGSGQILRFLKNPILTAIKKGGELGMTDYVAGYGPANTVATTVR